MRRLPNFPELILTPAAPADMAANVWRNTAVCFAAMNARRSALVNDQFSARAGAIPPGGKTNGAA